MLLTTDTWSGFWVARVIVPSEQEQEQCQEQGEAGSKSHLKKKEKEKENIKAKRSLHFFCQRASRKLISSYSSTTSASGLSRFNNNISSEAIRHIEAKYLGLYFSK
jgi:hypothetical protein